MRAAMEDEFGGVVETVAGVFVVAVEQRVNLIAAAVFGPTMPSASMLCSPCHCFTAAAVMEPKYPVGVGKPWYAPYKTF